MTEVETRGREIKDLYGIQVNRYIRFLLGGRCVKCGYRGLAIQIDHVHNDGAFERSKDIKGSLFALELRKIFDGEYEDYQLLCANCNMEKELRRRGIKEGHGVTL